MLFSKSWLTSRLRRSRFEQDMAAELSSHIERYVEDLVARGLPRDQAERRARGEFGSLQSVKEECREAVGLRWIDVVRRDLSYAWRVLRKSPTFTATVVAILALCIGANAAIFSLVDAVLLRSLPYPQPERLAKVVTTLGVGGEARRREGIRGAPAPPRPLCHRAPHSATTGSDPGTTRAAADPVGRRGDRPARRLRQHRGSPPRTHQQARP